MRRPSIRAGEPRRATTMLYMVGALAVMFILAFGFSDSTLRAFRSSSDAVRRSQAEEAARAGIAYARLHATDFATISPTSVGKAMGGGAFVCTVERGSSATLQIVSTGRAPSTRPRAITTLRARLGD